VRESLEVRPAKGHSATDKGKSRDDAHKAAESTAAARLAAASRVAIPERTTPVQPAPAAAPMVTPPVAAQDFPSPLFDALLRMTAAPRLESVESVGSAVQIGSPDRAAAAAAGASQSPPQRPSPAGSLFSEDAVESPEAAERALLLEDGSEAGSPAVPLRRAAVVVPADPHVAAAAWGGTAPPYVPSPARSGNGDTTARLSQWDTVTVQNPLFVEASWEESVDQAVVTPDRAADAARAQESRTEARYPLRASVAVVADPAPAAAAPEESRARLSLKERLAAFNAARPLTAVLPAPSPRATSTSNLFRRSGETPGRDLPRTFFTVYLSFLINLHHNPLNVSPLSPSSRTRSPLARGGAPRRGPQGHQRARLARQAAAVHADARPPGGRGGGA
jgi:hypothetical protein